MRSLIILSLCCLTACGGGQATDQEKLEADIAVAKANGTLMTTEPVSQDTCAGACE